MTTSTQPRWTVRMVINTVLFWGWMTLIAFGARGLVILSGDWGVPANILGVAAAVGALWVVVALDTKLARLLAVLGVMV